MKRLIFLCGLFFSCGVFANASWIEIVRSANGRVFFIDAKSIQRSGDSATFWLKSNYSNRNKFGDCSDKTQDTINCRTRESIMRWIMTYDDIDNKGRLTNNFDPKDSWVPISPDSVQWAIYEFVCRK
jgi:hypothetical protein